MILSRIFAEYPAVQLKPCVGLTNSRLRYLLPLLLTGISACGPKKPIIPEDVEAIAHRCYATLVTPERTPQLQPSEPMEDGTVMILWFIAELPDEQGSCLVDSGGKVLLLTSNTDTPSEEPSTEESTSQE